MLGRLSAWAWAFVSNEKVEILFSMWCVVTQAALNEEHKSIMVEVEAKHDTERQRGERVLCQKCTVALEQKVPRVFPKTMRFCV